MRTSWSNIISSKCTTTTQADESQLNKQARLASESKNPADRGELSYCHARLKTSMSNNQQTQAMKRKYGDQEEAFKYVIIGGGIAGVCCAEELARMIGSPGKASQICIISASDLLLQVRNPFLFMISNKFYNSC
ncbi:FAD-binding oxidoreductase [archaeon]|nr:MAG: FAD-binding oxidoreductase [archaeon]